jgi:hypothetical protein
MSDGGLLREFEELDELEDEAHPEGELAVGVLPQSLASPRACSCAAELGRRRAPARVGWGVRVCWCASWLAFER